MLKQIQNFIKSHNKLFFISLIALGFGFIALLFVGQRFSANSELEDKLANLHDEYTPKLEEFQKGFDFIDEELVSQDSQIEEYKSKTSEFSGEMDAKDEKLAVLQGEKVVYEQDLGSKNNQVVTLSADLKRLQYENAPKVIDINLSTQTLVALEYGEVIQTYIISSGKSTSYTIPGNFSISAKYPSMTYSGSDYNYPDTPWNMRYYGDFLIHTAYWHNDFGTPVSHGCINMREPEANWLYHWSPIGTSVKVHY